MFVYIGSGVHVVTKTHSTDLKAENSSS